MKPRLSNQQNAALTLVEVTIVIAVLVIVVALILPALAMAKRKTSHISCANDLKQVGIAFRLWEGDNNGKYPMVVSVTNGGAMELIATGNVAACFQVMSNEVNTPKILLCPEDTRRVYATNFSTGFGNTNISYFVGLDAVESKPQMILVGDDNLTVGGVRVQPGILNFRTNATVGWTKERHQGNGNTGLADGSVQQLTQDGLRQAFQQTGIATNRLAIP
jgi:prepilin-type processing-associated H-X9-DG protein